MNGPRQETKGRPSAFPSRRHNRNPRKRQPHHGEFSSLLGSPRGRRKAAAPSLGGERLAAITLRVTLQVFELNGLSETLEKVDPCASGNISTWLGPVPRMATPFGPRCGNSRPDPGSCSTRAHCACFPAGARGAAAFSRASVRAVARFARLF